jgi:aspartate racemase
MKMLGNHNAGKKIGIITGSGPEAGLDLWKKILQSNRALLGESFRGDLDAPNVTLFSEPLLGLSMELEQYDTVVWDCLSTAAQAMSQRVDYYVIACNTLNYYQPKLDALNLSAKLISFADVVLEYLRENKIGKIALLGARPVTDLGAWSPYQKLIGYLDIELPKPIHAVQLHQLIYDVKTFGGEIPEIRSRFRAIIDSLESQTVLLACTELPLIALKSVRHQLIDVTELVARKLVRLSQLKDSIEC